MSISEMRDVVMTDSKEYQGWLNVTSNIVEIVTFHSSSCALAMCEKRHFPARDN